MNFINYNGKLLPEDTPIINGNNRGLRFGDGLFETLKYRNDRFILLDEHLARLWQGLRLLQFQLPKLFTPDLLEEQLQALIDKNKLQHARIRITVFRGSGGLYDTDNHHPNYLLQCWPLNNQTGQWNENGLHCCLYEAINKTTDAISNCKHNNFLPYVQGALYAQQERCNDALIFNIHHRICDSTIANVFWIKDGQVFTPPLSEGCIAGIIRNEIMKALKGTSHEVIEYTLSRETLMQADEIFLTNSIYEMRWVSRVDDRNYSCVQSMQIRMLLRQTNPDVFC